MFVEITHKYKKSSMFRRRVFEGLIPAINFIINTDIERYRDDMITAEINFLPFDHKHKFKKRMNNEHSK